MSRGRALPLRRKAALIVLGAACAGLGLELWLRLVPSSDGLNLTQRAHAWNERYWRPINGLGYRDDEHVCPGPDGPRVVMVLGDSVAAGQGVADYRETFPRVLQQLLGEGWRVMTVAQKGWDTEAQWRALQGNPCAPDVVVLSYVLNDIEASARRHGQARRFSSPRLPRAVWWLASRSFLVNEAVWLSWSPHFRQELAEVIRTWQPDAATWADHAQVLGSLVDEAGGRGAAVVAVCFPWLRAVADSARFTRQVAEILASRRVAVLDLSPRLLGEPTNNLVVSLRDAHPSAALHRRVAEWLVPLVRAAGSPAGPGPE
jgi:lysophospholipase L1-like esterase